MEAIAITALNFAAGILDTFSALINRYPIIGQALPFMPALPALFGRAIFGALLCVFLGFVALILIIVGHGLIGLLLYCGAWFLSFRMARARKRQRLARTQLLHMQGER